MSAGRMYYLKVRGSLESKLDESPLARILLAVALFVWLAAMITQCFLAYHVKAQRLFSDREAYCAPAPGPHSGLSGGPAALQTGCRRV